MSNIFEIKQHIKDWYNLKAQIEELEKKLDIAKSKVIECMNENTVNVLVTDDHIVKRTKYNRETVNKKELPEDIWKQYVKKSDYWVYKVTEK